MSVLAKTSNWDAKIYSGGWRSSTGGTADVIEPATGETLATVGVASAEDVANAAQVAAVAQPAWADTSFEERGRVLRTAAQLLEDDAETAVDWIMRETGAVRGKAENEVAGSVGELREAAALTSHPLGELLADVDPTRLSFARRVPVGVVGVITPWNFPLILALRVVAPALALGNAVVLKPDVQTPVCGGFLIAKLLEEAGLPDGILHVLPGAAEAGEAVVVDQNVSMVSFTGSTATGARVGELAGRAMKKLSLELGGNNALIVLDDADVEIASSAGAWGSFLHQGQICLTTGRHLVDERIADEYVEALSLRAEALRVGNPLDPATALGPIINERQLQRVVSILDRTVAEGGTVRAGGSHDGLFFRPTVLAGVTPAMPAFTDEIFGPVAPVTTFSGDDEAIALANRTHYGLTAAIHTRSVGRGLRVARVLRTGMVHINDATVNDAPHVPFGGMGASGNGGRFGTIANVEEFTQWQWCTVRDRPSAFPF